MYISWGYEIPPSPGELCLLGVYFGWFPLLFLLWVSLITLEFYSTTKAYSLPGYKTQTFSGER